jgi:hypothetical protein
MSRGNEGLEELPAAEHLGHAARPGINGPAVDATKDGVGREQQYGAPGGPDRGELDHGTSTSWYCVTAHSSISACTNACGRLPRN